ncbi:MULTISPECIES: GtrA family protein [Stenotrophomonas]|uniref:GtrA family protein n=1 Tax=Stenotrophomonas TaxID=40323 RepID=UPI00066BE09C|nr:MULTISPECIES: GtrA family protein [Stenotrophomonas]KOQ76978.1 polysaccharide biosynthesis protein [Stenotrophomonas maltophilia]MBS4801900.1 GtrA family protein [Stenotrophomonas maltophilia]MDG9988531.1 GtrA family protein [Stenotrophomonas sp. GD04024]MDH2062028.1 GtrA family protein [Stenotrophomonas maltophilia]HDX0899090.1 GtrA family protein [Stenotrophomonas maltophilia]
MISIRALASDPRLKQFIIYAICGGTGVTLDLTTYTTLIYFGWNYQLANAIGYAAGTLVSFLLNRHFTFKTYDQTLRRLALFFGTALLGYLISSALLYLLVAVLQLSPLVSKLVTLAVVLILQFSLNRAVTFRASTDPSKP